MCPAHDPEEDSISEIEDVTNNADLDTEMCDAKDGVATSTTFDENDSHAPEKEKDAQEVEAEKLSEKAVSTAMPENTITPDKERDAAEFMSADEEEEAPTPQADQKAESDASKAEDVDKSQAQEAGADEKKDPEAAAGDQQEEADESKKFDVAIFDKMKAGQLKKWCTAHGISVVGFAEKQEFVTAAKNAVSQPDFKLLDLPDPAASASQPTQSHAAPEVAPSSPPPTPPTASATRQSSAAASGHGGPAPSSTAIARAEKIINYNAEKDWWKILDCKLELSFDGSNRAACMEEVDKRFKRLMAMYHPDKWRNAPVATADVASRITEAKKCGHKALIAKPDPPQKVTYQDVTRTVTNEKTKLTENRRMIKVFWESPMENGKSYVIAAYNRRQNQWTDLYIIESSEQEKDQMSTEIDVKNFDFAFSDGSATVGVATSLRKYELRSEFVQPQPLYQQPAQQHYHQAQAPVAPQSAYSYGHPGYSGHQGFPHQQSGFSQQQTGFSQQQTGFSNGQYVYGAGAQYQQQQQYPQPQPPPQQQQYASSAPAHQDVYQQAANAQLQKNLQEAQERIQKRQQEEAEKAAELAKAQEKKDREKRELERIEEQRRRQRAKANELQKAMMEKARGGAKNGSADKKKKSEQSAAAARGVQKAAAEKKKREQEDKRTREERERNEKKANNLKDRDRRELERRRHDRNRSEYDEREPSQDDHRRQGDRRRNGDRRNDIRNRSRDDDRRNDNRDRGRDRDRDNASARTDLRLSKDIRPHAPQRDQVSGHIFSAAQPHNFQLKTIKENGEMRVRLLWDAPTAPDGSILEQVCEIF